MAKATKWAKVIRDKTFIKSSELLPTTCQGIISVSLEPASSRSSHTAPCCRTRRRKGLRHRRDKEHGPDQDVEALLG